MQRHPRVNEKSSTKERLRAVPELLTSFRKAVLVSADQE
jgi:hypothetical protein